MKIIDKAKELFSQGFHVIPTRYKVPIESWWPTNDVMPNGQFTTANGIGIPLGKYFEGFGYLNALDVDCLDKKLSRDFYQWISDNIGDYPYRVGTKPKFLLPFFTTNPIESYSTPYYGESRIEILAKGKQFVAIGKPSDDTNYVWLNGTLSKTTIPVVDNINTVLDAWHELASSHGYIPNQRKELGSTYDELDFLSSVQINISHDEVITLLNRYPAEGLDYDSWVEVGMALYHQYDGSNEAYELWLNWSEKSSKHNDKSMPVKWNSFDRTDGSIKTMRTIIKKANNLEITVEQLPVVTTVKHLKPLTQIVGSTVAPKWVIKNIIENTDLVALFGPSGCAKSFIALDMALHIAHGLPYYDHKVHKGKVVYFVGEGYSGFIKRAKAWHQYHELEFTDNLYLMNDVIHFKSGGDELNREIIAELKSLQPQLVIIDTLARATAGLDENSSHEMGDVIRIMDNIKRVVGCTFLFIHHTGLGNQERMRGSSVIKGALENEMRVTRDKNNITLSNTKMKNHEEFQDIHLKLQQVNLCNNEGIELKDEDDEPIVSALVVKSDDSDVEPRASYSNSPNQVLLMDVMYFMRETGESISVMDEALVASMALDAPAEGYSDDMVRDEFVRRYGEGGNVTKIYARARRELVNKGYLFYANEVIYLM